MNDMTTEKDYPLKYGELKGLLTHFCDSTEGDNPEVLAYHVRRLKERFKELTKENQNESLSGN